VKNYRTTWTLLIENEQLRETMNLYKQLKQIWKMM